MFRSIVVDRKLRENHSGMETFRVHSSHMRDSALRENHSGMETKYDLKSPDFLFCCVRTIVVWKPYLLNSNRHDQASCVRTIVVWKRHFISLSITLVDALRENHSGMETFSAPVSSIFSRLLRENHSGMETRR